MTEDIRRQAKLNLKILYDRHGLSLGVSRDWLQAYVLYAPGEPSEYGAQDNVGVLDEKLLRSLLAEHHIVFGLQEEAIASFLANPPHDKEVLIAQGIPAVPGENGRIEYVYDKKDGSHIPKELNGGKVDFKNLDLTVNVRKGDVLAQRILPTEGTPGRKVNGEEIPAKKGKDRPFTLGRNTTVSEDGLQLHAEIDGTISQVSNKVSVVGVYTVKGDVDYSTGNISFVGTVEIMGSVLSGFQVEAKDDVSISGVVEGAKIIAGGNVTLRGGIQGAEKACIEAGGSIEAKFVNSAKLVAKERIRISGPVMHSVLEAGDRIELTGRNGVLSGGITRATHAVEVENLGSDLGVATTVEAGVHPEHAGRAQALAAELKTSQTNVQKLTQVILTLNTMKQTKGSLPPDREKMLLDSIKTRYAMLALIKQLEQERQELEEEAKQAETGHIRARGVVFPGVTVRIGGLVSKVDHVMKNVTLRREEGEISAT